MRVFGVTPADTEGAVSFRYGSETRRVSDEEFQIWSVPLIITLPNRLRIPILFF